MKRTYQNKTIIITDAAGGMGRAFSYRFGQAGGKLVLLDLNFDSVEQRANDLSKENIEAIAF